MVVDEREIKHRRIGGRGVAADWAPHRPNLGDVDVGPMMGRGMMGGWGYPYGMGWGFMFAGMLVPFLFIVLVVVGAYLWLTSRKEPGESEKALTILDERYAKGEITKEQYLEMKSHLTK